MNLSPIKCALVSNNVKLAQEIYEHNPIQFDKEFVEIYKYAIELDYVKLAQITYDSTRLSSKEFSLLFRYIEKTNYKLSRTIYDNYLISSNVMIDLFKHTRAHKSVSIAKYLTLLTRDSLSPKYYRHDILSNLPRKTAEWLFSIVSFPKIVITLYDKEQNRRRKLSIVRFKNKNKHTHKHKITKKIFMDNTLLPVVIIQLILSYSTHSRFSELARNHRCLTYVPTDVIDFDWVAFSHQICCTHTASKINKNMIIFSYSSLRNRKFYSDNDEICNKTKCNGWDHHAITTISVPHRKGVHHDRMVLYSTSNTIKIQCPTCGKNHRFSYDPTEIIYNEFVIIKLEHSKLELIIL